ncbi:MAG: carbon monoxide dehydrogenase [Anaerolineae bacterium]|nr:carbon monoxide dehydrogenase [Anaerolineae bacterium]
MNVTPDLMHTSSTLTFANHWDHFLARWGYRRGNHRVTPGLYKLGHPTPESPVFVTANYTLSFDALRSSLPGVDGYILVLDTLGINVWCAAGKGTFGTDEIVRRVEATRLSEVVSHRTLILPQLGAPGVAAHEVKQRTGFKVEYGPVRADDLPEYLKTHQATPEMRQVHFPLYDRLVLIPVELVHLAKPTALAVLVLTILLGPLAATGAVAAVLAGAALFPILLPWLPTEDFISKGFILGGLTALPFALAARQREEKRGWPLAYMLGLPPVTAFLALNFTGSTPFTSKTGVKREMFRYIRVMAGMFGAGVLLALGLRLTQKSKKATR